MAAAPVISSRTRDQLSRAHRAASAVARLDTEAKNSILLTMARDLEWNQDRILAANAQDLSADLTVAVRDRLLLNPERIGSMVEGIRAVAALDDPVGKVIAQWTRPNGLRIRQIRVPLGVLGVVYEARPNVTADAIALALKAGNTVVLRGGRDATRTNQVLVAILS